MAEAPGEGDLGLSVVVQSPSYKWNIRITQVRCNQVGDISKFTECGETGAAGFVRDLASTSSAFARSQDIFDPDNALEVNGQKLFKHKRRKRRRKTKSAVEEVK